MIDYKAFSCAQDKIRTCTSFRTPPPQSGLSTSFNTWAGSFQNRDANLKDLPDNSALFCPI